MIEEEIMLLFETEQGLVATNTINPQFYPLVTHFASEQIRWMNGGEEPKLVLGELR